MKTAWMIVALGGVLMLAACQGETNITPYVKGEGQSVDPFAPCTDPNECCENPTCKGDPDGVMICGCADLWDCSKNPKKCEQPRPEPPGGGDWNCTWNEFRYTCTQERPDGKGDTPPGGGGWSCLWNDKEFTWECTRDEVPNPVNTPEGAGVWTCVVDGELIICERNEGTTEPPVGGGEWTCTTDETGKEVCEKTDENGGLPEGGGDWKCNKITKAGVPVWVCYGESDTPPGGGGWNCEKVGGEFNTWKCERTETITDVPPGGGWWSCVKGSEFNGTLCEKVPTEPLPPTPEGGGKCAVGEVMWCDGLNYCGWGQVQCDQATGEWATKLDADGNTILDCYELENGHRPNTVCACYHFYYNPACCERPDCIVPTGSTGQLCPTSPGQLCDYCNPQNSECQENGARCVVTDHHETFCGRDCSNSQPCPTGYICQALKLLVGMSQQCVPADFSCYY